MSVKAYFDNTIPLHLECGYTIDLYLPLRVYNLQSGNLIKTISEREEALAVLHYVCPDDVENYEIVDNSFNNHIDVDVRIGIETFTKYDEEGHVAIEQVRYLEEDGACKRTTLKLTSYEGAIRKTKTITIEHTEEPVKKEKDKWERDWDSQK